MKKQLPAILASFLITLVIGLGMVIMGSDAVLNPNGVPVQNSPTVITPANVGTADSQSQVAQLQNLVSQYQQREQQYQTELTTAQNQLNQDAATIQQFQRLMQIMQSRGLITIDQNGRVFLPGG